MPSLTRSQLVLRSGATQLVMGSAMHVELLVEVVTSALKRQIGYPRTEILWGDLCREVARQSSGDEPVTLSIPAQPDVPGVWVSEIAPRRFSVAATIRGTHQWEIISREHDLDIASSAA